MIQPNLIELTLSHLVPAYAARRYCARMAFAELGKISERRYDAAQRGRRTENWIAGNQGANAEIGPQNQVIRARVRDLVRNNPYAANAPRKLAGHIIGAGIVPRVVLENHPEIKQQFTDDWDRFAEVAGEDIQLDYYGLQKLAIRTVVESGEALFLMLPDKSLLGRGVVPMRARVLEPDHLDGAKTETLADGGAIIQGVEFDAEGRRVAYWLFDVHPGEGTSFVRRKYLSTRIEAKFVRHVFDVLRPGQVRGVSWLAPVALKMRDLDDYDTFEIVRKKMEAVLSTFVKRTGGTAAEPLGKATTDSAGERIEKLASGEIHYLQAGEDVSFTRPEPTAGYSDYMAQQLHAIAAGIGCTYEQLTGDLTKVNFSSLRAGRLDFWINVDQWQKHMAVPNIGQAVWNFHDSLARFSGVRANGAPRPRVIWVPPKRAALDPDKETKATVQELRAGLTSYQRAVTARGDDPDEIIAEIVENNATLDKHKIALDSDARRPMAGSARGDDAQAKPKSEDD